MGESVRSICQKLNILMLVRDSHAIFCGVLHWAGLQCGILMSRLMPAGIGLSPELMKTEETANETDHRSY